VLRRQIQTFLLLSIGLLALGKAAPANPLPDSSQTKKNNLLSYFQQGKLKGHFRYYYMHTNNEAGLSDYFAHAIGGGLHYLSAPLYGLQFGVGGFYIFNIGSSDLSEADPATGHTNRYELGQFNVLDPHNHHDLDRLEDLFVRFTRNGTQLTLGRQVIHTPFINPQDGRMRPTGENGLWWESQLSSRFTLKGAWLYEISPRGTVEWFSIGNSLGKYSVGINEKGSHSTYDGHIRSEGIGMLSAEWKMTDSSLIQLCHQHVDNLFGTSFLQINGGTQSEYAWLYGLQLLHQATVGQGGNPDPALQYVSKNWQSWAASIKTGIRTHDLQCVLAYTRITRHGRYIMPREWGRDPFFTFMARERIEGAGDVHALMLSVQPHHHNHRLHTEISAGYFNMPDVRNYRLSKYEMPDFWQVNADIRYHFGGFLEGLESELLCLYKGNLGETYNEASYRINKTNMWQLNAILNFHF
jgi:hypothetical protein